MQKDYNHQSGKQIAATTAEECIQYFRELAVLEAFCSDLDNKQISKDPDDVLCTQTMWRRVV